MPALIFKVIYLGSLVAEIVIRATFDRMRRRNSVQTNRASPQEAVLFGLLTLGSFFLPLVYVFTPWLSFADYHLPDWAGWLGVVILAGVGGLILFLPMYVIRMPQEEQMMIGQFGDVYRAYMQRTGRVLPRWHKN